MIKKYWKTLVITSVIILLPMVAGLFLWDQLPERIPTHWNAAGEVDGWSSKAFGVFALPSILLAVQWFCCFATATDPKKANHGHKVMQLVLWITPLLSVVLMIATYTAALGQAVRMEVLMPLLVGLLLAVVGNYMPKCKQNYTIGIKIPWTLSSEENWNKTHRLAGWVWMICGVVIMLSGILGYFWKHSFWVLIAVMPVMIFVPLGYSYSLYKKGS